ncbi:MULTISPECIES: TetR/AcrR family transcriptional regulator [unclassified Streptomyces]|uniref:TetR/AcrR family transcriptional regulator n=1 Tax=unclassified Streptomyces TaxID=2593676 RepID=UPI002E3525CB|nr:MULTISPECIES: TetR family transcriptional regulator [unclassified Streptomyces]
MTGRDTPTDRTVPAASETRDRIRDAAVAAFAERGYDGVGLREIARRAGVDPRLVGHYFGSKEGLFTQALEFTMDMPFTDIRESTVAFLASPPGRSMDGLLMTIRSTSSPEAVQIMRELIELRFEEGLAEGLTGERRRERAALIMSVNIGFLLMRDVLGVGALNGDAGDLDPYLGAALESLVDGSPAVDRPELPT